MKNGVRVCQNQRAVIAPANIGDFNIIAYIREDIRETLVNLGNEVIFYQKEPRNYRQDPRFRSELRNYVKEEHIDLIFSSNYYPMR